MGSGCIHYIHTQTYLGSVSSVCVVCVWDEMRCFHLQIKFGVYFAGRESAKELRHVRGRRNVVSWQEEGERCEEHACGD